MWCTEIIAFNILHEYFQVIAKIQDPPFMKVNMVVCCYYDRIRMK